MYILFTAKCKYPHYLVAGRKWKMWHFVESEMTFARVRGVQLFPDLVPKADPPVRDGTQSDTKMRPYF